MIRASAILSVLALLIAGCSTKEYYKPEKTVDDWPTCRVPHPPAEAAAETERACTQTGDYLVSKNAQGGVTREGWVIDKAGESGIRLSAEERYLGTSGGWDISTGIDGNVTLRSRDGNRSIVMPLEKTVAAAAVKDDYLAVLFASNDMGLYRLSTRKSYYKLPGTPATAVDARIARPYFLGTLVVFPTLDGRLVVVDYERKELLRSTVVSSEPYFDNIFYFNVIGDTMVAATQHRLFSLGDTERRQKYDLRDAVFDAEGIWVATKEGEVIHLTPALQPVAKTKFPFAHFLGLIVGKEKLYLLEKEGYLIVMDKAMTQTEVYDVPVADDAGFVSENAFFVGDKIIYVGP